MFSFDFSPRLPMKFTPARPNTLQSCKPQQWMGFDTSWRWEFIGNLHTEPPIRTHTRFVLRESLCCGQEQRHKMKAPKKTALRKATSKSTPTKRRKAICPYSRGESEPPRDAPHWSPYWTPHPKFFSGRPRNASLPPVVHPPTHIRNKPRVHPDEKPPKLDMWPQEWHRGDMPQSNALTQAEGPEIDLAPDEVASGVTASSYL